MLRSTKDQNVLIPLGGILSSNSPSAFFRKKRIKAAGAARENNASKRPRIVR
jgi:hypothetical protein